MESWWAQPLWVKRLPTLWTFCFSVSNVIWLPTQLGSDENPDTGCGLWISCIHRWRIIERRVNLWPLLRALMLLMRTPFSQSYYSSKPWPPNAILRVKISLSLSKPRSRTVSISAHRAGCSLASGPTCESLFQGLIMNMAVLVRQSYLEPRTLFENGGGQPWLSVFKLWSTIY